MQVHPEESRVGLANIFHDRIEDVHGRQPLVRISLCNVLLESGHYRRRVGLPVLPRDDCERSDHGLRVLRVACEHVLRIVRVFVRQRVGIAAHGNRGERRGMGRAYNHSSVVEAGYHDLTWFRSASSARKDCARSIIRPPLLPRQQRACSTRQSVRPRPRRPLCVSKKPPAVRILCFTVVAIPYLRKYLTRTCMMRRKKSGQCVPLEHLALDA